MSEEPPQGTPAGEPAKTAETHASTAEPAAASAPSTTPQPSTTMEDAAKAMSDALPEEKADVIAPAIKATTSPTITTVEPPNGAPPAANTSGMHLQYVAPGVKRQSFMQDVKWQALIFCAILLFTALFFFRGGGIDSELGGSNGATASNGTPPSQNTTHNGNVVPTQTALPPEDSTYEPLQNRAPTADLTVNAGAIGDPAPFPKRRDAGVNKGGYADERKDLEAAEAMIATDPDKALALVDRHDKDYPRGIMDPNARMIRIEAFQKKGDDAKALQLGNEFLEDYPHSGPASHVQEIVEALKKKNGGGP